MTIPGPPRVGHGNRIMKFSPPHATLFLALSSWLTLCIANSPPEAVANEKLDELQKPANATGAVSLFDLAESEAESKSSTKFEYQAQVSRLMNLIVHSMYENQEVFIRELLANGCDAIDKLRHDSLGKMDASEITKNAKVLVRLNKPEGTISFIDNGIGMTRQHLIDYLGTIAKSGTAEILSKLQEGKDATNLIGQFGVGFYTAYLAADEVAVASKNDSDPKQHIWLSKAESGGFSIFEDPRGNTLTRGTEVILKLKPSALKFLEQDQIKKIMETYASFYPYPIYLESVKVVEEEVEDVEEAKESEKEGTDDEANVEGEEKESEKPKKIVKKEVLEEIHINATKPIWLRDPKDVSEAEYNQLFRTMFKENDDPLTYIHFKAEGEFTFRGLLFIPKKPFSFGFDERERKSVMHLYIRRAFVTDKVDDFFPPALTFIKGVVDSDDLGLNISRETLQNSSALRTIKAKTLSKVFEALKKSTSDSKKYKEIFDSYGDILKHMSLDQKHRSKIIPLLRFPTNKSEGELIGFQEYVDRMKPEQKQIYYLAGANTKEIEKSPYLEKLKAGDFEVFYMTGSIDEHVITNLKDFDNHDFQNAASEKFKLPGESDDDVKKQEKEFKPLIDIVQKTLDEDIEKVKLSTRLVDSPYVVVASQHGWTGNMERVIMAQASAKDFPMMEFYAKQKKIFEINPNHALIKSLLALAKKNPKSKNLRERIRLLFDAGMIQAGYMLKDPNSFGSLVTKLASNLSPETDSNISDVDEKKASKTKKSDSKQQDKFESDHDEL